MSQDFKTPPTQSSPDPLPAKPTPSPNPPTLPEAGSTSRGPSPLSWLNLATLLASLGLLGYLINLQRQAPSAEKPGAEASKAGDEVRPEVDRLKDKVKNLTRKIEDRTADDPTPRIKSIDEKVSDLDRTLRDLNARFDALSPKIDALTKAEGQDLSPKVESIEKRLGEVSASIESLKTEFASKTSAVLPASEAANDLDRAVDLFKKGKYPESKAAFARLQATAPDDARVWYYSALANGLATGDWGRESERLVALGVARERAGSPDKAKINAAFADLTTPTGKDWLTYYRTRPNP